MARGGVLVDGSARVKSYRLVGGEELEIEVPEPSELVPRRTCGSRSSSRTRTCSSSTSRQASSRTPPAGTERRRFSSTACSRWARRRGPGAAGDRAPARPGHVGTARGRTLRRCPRAAVEAIRKRALERRYLALVRGAPRSRTGRIEAAVGRDRNDRSRHSLDTETPRDAVTWFELREQLGARALLELRLETGRTHQIRVHLEAIGLPVCGDPTYGVAAISGSSVSFSTPTGWASSSIRSPARRSTWSRRCRSISARRSNAPARADRYHSPAQNRLPGDASGRGCRCDSARFRPRPQAHLSNRKDSPWQSSP